MTWAPTTAARTPVGGDLRLAGLGAAAWAGALAGHAAARAWPGPPGAAGTAAGVLVALLALVLVVVRRRISGSWLLVAAVLGIVSLLRVEATTDNAVTDLAEHRSLVTAVARVSSDPVVRPGRFSDVLVYRVTLTRIEQPTGVRTRVPAVVLEEPDGLRPGWGSTVRIRGRLSPADDPDTAALLSPLRSPTVLSAPSVPHRWAEAVRRSVRDAAGGPSPGDVLVPALVDGDDVALPEEVVTDFRTAGLTHLTAVSGANLTILLAFLLPCARLCGVRAHGLVVVGAIGIVGFVLVARPEPSVLRAAAMGVAALVGLGWGGRVAGARALGGAVVGLLLVAPGLAVTWGFALSVAATAGILFLAPPVRDALATHLPRWLAEAVAVPLAAQVACTPLVAVLSAEVSVVSVVANLVAAPLVGPTTVLGLAGGLLALVADPLGAVPGWVAGICAHGIVVTARAAAASPGAAVPWSPTGWRVVVLVLLCLLLAALAPRLLRDRRTALLVATVLVVALLRPPLPGWVGVLVPGGWPPPGWAMVMCDVGQGDAVVLPAGAGRAVVVDAGPEPRAVDACLRRLRVRDVPVLVLTHFHHDHVAGISGVMRGRDVGEVLVSPLPSPAYGAGLVDRATREAGVPVRVPVVGETVAVDALRWQLLGPGPGATATEPNDASLVLLADVGGVSVLLTGDVEPTSQAALRRSWALGQVDVLKVPHHGSRYQDDALLQALSPRVALVSSGEDNDYGHPADRTLDLLRAAGASVWRTDTSGDLAVVRDRGRVRVVPRD
jgi:competence protein ComEC